MDAFLSQWQGAEVTVKNISVMLSFSSFIIERISFHNMYHTSKGLGIQCTIHLCDSCCLIEVDPHFIPSSFPDTDMILKQLSAYCDVINTWAGS